MVKTLSINPIDELISLMDAKYNSETDIEAAFDKIADILLNKVKITRGNKCYYIGEIEFYLYTDSHRDIITYPRNTKSLQWYRNAFFGIDLTFNSHVGYDDNKQWYTLDEHSPYFGGILIRSIYNKDTLIDKPRNCADLLFDCLDATNTPEDYPLLVESSHRVLEKQTSPRTNLIKKNATEEYIRKKVVGLLYNNGYYYEEKDVKDWMVESFKYFISKPYKYFVDIEKAKNLL